MSGLLRRPPAGSSQQPESRIVRRRMVTVFGLMVVLGSVLLGRLAYLQVGQHRHFATMAQNNRIFLTRLAPVRGLIRDRNGATLADNFSAHNLEILPSKVRDMDALLDELGQLVEVTAEDLDRFRELLKRRPAFEWQTLRANLSQAEAARVALNSHRHLGIELRGRLQRRYPYGALTAHAVGYVDRINPKDLEKIQPQDYRGLEYIGRSGIEAYYESILRGESGTQQVETTAHGRAVRTLEKTPPAAGRTTYLGLDIELQRKSLAALDGYEGAIVAIEPASGEVLAFASAPSFDPNPFVNGISRSAYAALRNAEARPLLNRALFGRYAPGSTIKGFMLLVGLENKLDPDKRRACRGWFSLPNRSHRYRDWKKGGHGPVDAHDGIAQSCDVYFYRLADELGIDAMHAGMTRLGFGQRTGLDLADEPSGLMPSPAHKWRTKGEAWYPGETVITGIGQGYMLVTPLQLAVAAARLANRGQRVRPRLLAAVENPRTQVKNRLPPNIASPEKLPNGADFGYAYGDPYDYVINSMRSVVHGKKGTGRGIGRGLRYEIAGKTGTAQVKSIAQNEEYDAETVEKKFRDHSLFIAFAPIDEPKIAIAVVVEHAGSGSAVAAPIARQLIDYYLIERLGMFSPSVAAQ